MGNPKPSIKWTRDGVAVESGAHFQGKTEDRHALLTILDCSKADSGPYMITADNSLGSDFATINVQGSVPQSLFSHQSSVTKTDTRPHPNFDAFYQPNKQVQVSLDRAKTLLQNISLE